MFVLIVFTRSNLFLKPKTSIQQQKHPQLQTELKRGKHNQAIQMKRMKEKQTAALQLCV